MTLFLLKMALKNAFRHRLRAALTLAGLTIAILAFGLLSTVVSAWYAGADAASDKRLISRNAISLVFPLPISYADRIRSVDGVSGISWANWFGGVYIEPKNFFPQFAVDVPSYLPLYPEFVLNEDQRAAFMRDRQGCMVGRKLAERFGWKVGDTIPIKGTIYPGTYRFTLRAIYTGRDKGTDESQFLFHWKLLNERIKVLYPRRGDATGIFVVGIRDGSQAALISERVDAQFKNSLAETLTETEKAFQLSFVAMTDTIVLAIQIVSYVVILIIAAVMANTMAMSARERTSEYATLKALGFGPPVVGWLILFESVLMCAIGGALGILLTIPAVAGIGKALSAFLPVFNISAHTVLQQAAGAVVVGLIAAAVPAWRSMQIRIVEGLRAVA
ncbi:ABC transporter permease [Chitinimonas sp.]|uniref:ABC transporter permease n=1 Tax=Chitinimonas sp. TaxID=1934313 RepID=UPI0035ADDC1C